MIIPSNYVIPDVIWDPEEFAWIPVFTRLAGEAGWNDISFWYTVLMDTVKIIQLNKDQWEGYKNLRLKALKDNPESFGQTYDKAFLRTDEEWKLLLEKSADGLKRWVFFAKLDEELVGMVSGQAMESVKGGVKIREMFVSREARGKGIAKKLMRALTEELTQNIDERVLRLGVFKTQTEAVNLYKSLGFEIVEEKTESFPNGITHESLIMEKRLEQPGF